MTVQDMVETNKKSHTYRTWYYYLGGLFISFLLLTFIDKLSDAETSPDEDPSTAPHNIHADSQFSENMQEARKRQSGISNAFISALNKNEEWKKGMKRYLNTIVKPLDDDWDQPPAALPITDEIKRIQENAMQSSASYRSLIISEIMNIPGGGNYEIIFRIGERKYIKEIKRNIIEIGPIDIVPESIEIYVERIILGGIFSRTKRYLYTNKTRILFDSIKASSSIPVKLSLMKEAEDVRGDQINQDDVYLKIILSEFDPDKHSDKDAQHITPEVLKKELPAAPHIIEHSDSVTFNAADASDNLLIRGDEKYTTVLIFSNTDLTRDLKCIKTDTNEQIGVYYNNENISVFSAVVNNWSSLLLTVSVFNIDEFLPYTVIAAKGNQERGKELVLWYLGRHLLRTEENKIPLSNLTIENNIDWLISALNISYLESEIELVEDKEIRAVLTYLMEKTSRVNN